MPQIYHNVCTLDCPAACRLLTEVENGRIVNIKGDPQYAYTQGKLCAKGYALKERVYSSERILHPMKQQGKGSGIWQKISWEQAYTEIAEKMIEIDEQYGNLLPVCLDKYLGTTGFLSQSVDYFFDSLGPVTRLAGNPCVTTGTDALVLNYGACKKPVPEDMLNSRLIIIWGANLAWTNIHQMRYIFEAQDQGAIIVTIDPIVTATAARSDVYYQIHPETDGKLALGLAKILVNENMIDDEFLDHCTLGWSEYRSYLATVDLDEVAEATGIPLDKIYELAILYGTTKPATIRIGPGIQHGLSGGQNIRAIDSLVALSGNIGISGGNIHYTLGEYSQLRTPYSMKQNLNKSAHRVMGMDWFTQIEAIDPPLKLLWIAGRNPVAQDPDSNLVVQALQKIDTVVVADHTLTATARMADYLLPVCSPFEFEDFVVSFWHYGAGLNQQAIRPLGESKPDFEIMKEMADTLNRLKPEMSSFPTHITARQWLNQEFGPDLYVALGIKDYRDLVEKYARLNLPDVPWEDRQFATPSGRYEFFSNTAIVYQVPPLPSSVEQPVLSTLYPFRLMVVRYCMTLNSQFYHGSSLRHLEDAPVLLVHPETGRLQNLGEGDWAKVYNQMGQIELPIVYSLTVPKDILVTYIGMEDSNGKAINTLIGFFGTDMGQISSGSRGIAFNNCFVNLMRR